MALVDDNLIQIKKRILNAYKVEEHIIQDFRKLAVNLKSNIKKINPYSVNTVSFVSADGGDNRFHFNPSVIELVRVVDSRGVECALDAIPSSSTSEYLDLRLEKGKPEAMPPLQKLCFDLNMKVTDLSYLLKGMGQPGKSTGAVRTYRDIVEWAVLYDLLFKDWGSDTILIREGLLRSKSFKLDVFPKIDEKIRMQCQLHKKNRVHVTIVGIAKQSAVLSKLAIALELERVFHNPYPCYVEVDKEIQDKCYNFDHTWVDTLDTGASSEDGINRYQSFGKLYLVKFGDSPYDPVWPVDIAEWDKDNADKIIGQLLNDASPGFPIPDFPQSIQKAHEYASISGLEISILQDILLEGISKNYTDLERESLLRMSFLAKNLTSRRYKHA